MKFTTIASKGAKELLRDRRGLIMILIFPLFFMLVFGFAFGGMGQANQPHDIAVINNDELTFTDPAFLNPVNVIFFLISNHLWVK